MGEIDRIRQVYAKRNATIKSDCYSHFNPSMLHIAHQRERSVLSLLRQYGMDQLEDKRILDVGCGVGGELRRFIEYGARPENLYGVDLLSDRIERAKALNPLINLQCANAEELPYEDEYFDIVIQFTMFTSILDNAMKGSIAQEMLRVLKLDGIILWYDYHISKPTNPDVKGVGKEEIMRLFPNCSFHFKRVTLAPPLTRLIAPYSLLLCYLLEKVPLLCTHYLAVIRKRKTEAKA